MFVPGNRITVQKYSSCLQVYFNINKTQQIKQLVSYANTVSFKNYCEYKITLQMKMYKKLFQINKLNEELHVSTRFNFQ